MTKKNADIQIVEAHSEDNLTAVYAIRRKVFVEEQGVPEAEEYDEYESTSTHYLALFEGVPAATCRWRWKEHVAKLERFAVLPAFRRKGIASLLVQQCIKAVAEAAATQVGFSGKLVLHAQLSAVPLYASNGFEVKGQLFYECDIAHLRMELDLSWLSRRPVVILAIESSCDETAASVIVDGHVRSNIIATQEIHGKYGGVVPEVASRTHQEAIMPVVEESLKQAQLGKGDVTAIAVTQGPGLLGALLVGYSFAKGLAQTLGIPLIPVHHMKAHILSHFIDEPKPTFPYLCLTVSGGHTQIVKVSSPIDMQVLGTTHDDAVGEAYDKTARLLGFAYPGGKWIDYHAQTGDAKSFAFPVKNQMPGYDYSFSGVKTAFQNFINQKGRDFATAHLDDICASVQYTLVELLIQPLIRASQDTGISQIAIAGGVAANKGLRARLQELAELHHWQVFIPAFEYCTDNAAMVAAAGHLMLPYGQSGSREEEWLESAPHPSLPF